MKSHSAQDPHDKEWYHDRNREHTCSIIGKLHLLRGIRSETKGTIKGQLLQNQSKIKNKNNEIREEPNRSRLHRKRYFSSDYGHCILERTCKLIQLD